ncbi:hypothetical protein BH10PSE19_BH10PSE19_01000 [soil metagenome]
MPKSPVEKPTEMESKRSGKSTGDFYNIAEIVLHEDDENADWIEDEFYEDEVKKADIGRKVDPVLTPSHTKGLPMTPKEPWRFVPVRGIKSKIPGNPYRHYHIMDDIKAGVHSTAEDSNHLGVPASLNSAAKSGKDDKPSDDKTRELEWGDWEVSTPCPWFSVPSKLSDHPSVGTTTSFLSLASEHPVDKTKDQIERIKPTIEVNDRQVSLFKKGNDLFINKELMQAWGHTDGGIISNKLCELATGKDTKAKEKNGAIVRELSPEGDEEDLYIRIDKEFMEKIEELNDCLWSCSFYMETRTGIQGAFKELKLPIPSGQSPSTSSTSPAVTAISAVLPSSNFSAATSWLAEEVKAGVSIHAKLPAASVEEDEQEDKDEEILETLKYPITGKNADKDVCISTNEHNIYLFHKGGDIFLGRDFAEAHDLEDEEADWLLWELAAGKEDVDTIEGRKAKQEKGEIIEMRARRDKKKNIHVRVSAEFLQKIKANPQYKEAYENLTNTLENLNKLPEPTSPEATKYRRKPSTAPKSSVTPKGAGSGAARHDDSASDDDDKHIDLAESSDDEATTPIGSSPITALMLLATVPPRFAPSVGEEKEAKKKNQPAKPSGAVESKKETAKPWKDTKNNHRCIRVNNRDIPLFERDSAIFIGKELIVALGITDTGQTPTKMHRLAAGKCWTAEHKKAQNESGAIVRMGRLEGSTQRSLHARIEPEFMEHLRKWTTRRLSEKQQKVLPTDFRSRCQEAHTALLNTFKAAGRTDLNSVKPIVTVKLSKSGHEEDKLARGRKKRKISKTASSSMTTPIRSSSSSSSSSSSMHSSTTVSTTSSAHSSISCPPPPAVDTARSAALPAVRQGRFFGTRPRSAPIPTPSFNAPSYTPGFFTPLPAAGRGMAPSPGALHHTPLPPTNPESVPPGTSSSATSESLIDAILKFQPPPS